TNCATGADSCQAAAGCWFQEKPSHGGCGNHEESYSLYLWKQPFLNRTSFHLWAGFPLNVVLALSCATASYWIVERPFLKLREAMKASGKHGARHEHASAAAHAETLQAA